MVVINMSERRRFSLQRDIIMMSNESGKPVYLENVDWSMLGLRERLPGEPVHCRDEQFDPCKICGMRTGVWVVSESTHYLHPDKCT